jgi:hypothetical protein
MGMKQTIDVLNRMEADGIIGRYAIAGAVATYNYVEPTVTEDLVVLVAFDRLPGKPALDKPGLVTLGPILSHLADRGYSEFRREGILIEGWPVQFLPVADDLDAEALTRAEDVEIEIDPAAGPVRTRVLRPEHLVAAALRVDRAKDRARMLQFLEEEAVDLALLCDVIGRHGLIGKWQAFCRTSGIVDPCRVTSTHEKP